MKNEDQGLGRLVGNVVFVPTGVAYGWAVVGHVIAGLTLYLAFIAGAVSIGLFKEVKDWPRVSQVTLVASPIMVAAGCCFSLIPTSYYMLIPTLIYLLMTIVGWRALAAKFDR